MKWILVAVLLVSSATPALARISDITCRFYFGDEDYAPPEILEVLKQEHGDAVRTCSHSIDLISRPVRGPFKVCQITQWRLVKEAGSLEFMPSESTYPGYPTLHMMIAEGDCPRQDDPRYIPAEDITAGVFVAAVRYWEEISSSAAGLEALLAELRGDTVSEQYAKDLEDLETDFRNGEVALSAVRLGGNDKRTAPYFKLDLGRSGTFWSLLVDFEDDDLVILGLGMTIVD